MFSYLRSKPESIREWYVRIATMVTLFCIVVVYILIRVHKQTGSWHQGVERIQSVGTYGIGAFSKRLEDIRAPLRPVVVPQENAETQVVPETNPNTQTVTPEFKDVADI